MKKHEILEIIELRQSTLKMWQNCPLMYKAKFIDKVEPAFRYPGTIHGSALHMVLAWMHEGEWHGVRALYTKALNFYLYACDEEHIPVRWKRDMAKEIEALRVNAVEILENYRNKAYNQDALALFSEVKFRVKLPGDYLFTGTIDQVRKNPDGSIELLDFKSSKMRPNRYAIPNDLQLTLYSYAIKFGELLVDNIWVKPNMMVDSVGIYFLRAHEIYKRKVVGKEIGDEKGSPFMRTTKTIQDLRAFRTEIRHQLSAMVKPWYYPNTASCAFCVYSEHCIARNDTIPEKQADQAKDLLAELNMA